MPKALAVVLAGWVAAAPGMAPAGSSARAAAPPVAAPVDMADGPPALPRSVDEEQTAPTLEAAFTRLGDAVERVAASIAHQGGEPWIRLEARSRWCKVRSACGDEELAVIARHPSLRSLTVNRGNVTDRGLATISGLRRLTYLEVRTTATLTGRGVRHLARLPDLTGLQLGGIDLGEDDLDFLTQLPRLEHLKLANGPLRGRALDRLARLPGLTSLGLEGVRLESGFEPLGHLGALTHLSLLGTTAPDGRGGNASLDAGLKHLAGLKDLEYLEVSDATAAGLRQLGKLPRLRRICHAGPNLSDAQAQLLADAFGWTFEGACSCGCLDIGPRQGRQPPEPVLLATTSPQSGLPPAKRTPASDTGRRQAFPAAWLTRTTAEGHAGVVFP